MFDDILRAWKDRALDPLARQIGRAVHPTAITGVAALFGLASALLAWRGALGAALACWLANRVLDGLDGSVARTTGRASDAGGYLDLVLDFVVYAAVPLGLAAGSTDPRAALAAALLLAACYVNAPTWMLLSPLLERRARAEPDTLPTTAVRMPAGLIGGFETLLLWTSFFLWPSRLTVLLGTAAALVLLTAVLRTLRGVQAIGAAASRDG